MQIHIGLIRVVVGLAVVLAAVIATWIVVDSRAMRREEKVDSVGVDTSAGGSATTLAVLLHAFSRSPDSLGTIRAAVAEHYGEGDLDVLQPDMPLGTLSVVTTDRILAELTKAIDNAWQLRAATGKPYARVVLVGHSFGALLARNLYVIGWGESADAPFEHGLGEAFRDVKVAPLTTARPWAPRVERIVLMAGMNRGWSISHHMCV